MKISSKIVNFVKNVPKNGVNIKFKLLSRLTDHPTPRSVSLLFSIQRDDWGEPTLTRKLLRPNFIFLLYFLQFFQQKFRKSKCLYRIEMLVENCNFGRKWKFWSKIKILVENQNFGQESKLWSKIEIMVKHRNFRPNFGRKSKFCSKIESYES